MNQLKSIQAASEESQGRLLAAVDELLEMLREGVYGIDSRAAHALYWMTLGFKPPHPYAAKAAAECPCSLRQG